MVFGRWSVTLRRVASMLLLLAGLVLHGASTALAQSRTLTEPELWNLVKDSPADFSFEWYLDEFPDGPHAALAKEKLAALKQAAIDAAIAAHSNIVEMRARHILVKTEAEAEEIIGELQAGADFAKLAKSRSIDRPSAEQGGDLSWFNRNEMIPEFSDAAFALKPGEFSRTPVKTQYGYHIIKVDEAHYLPIQ